MSLPDIEATLPTLQQLMHQGVLLWTEAFIGQGAQPVSGSLAARERAQQGGLRGDWGDDPVEQGLMHVRTLSSIAQDQTVGLLALLNAESLYAPVTIARAAVEAYARAWWLTDPGIGTRARVARAMNERLHALDSSRTLPNAIREGFDPRVRTRAIERGASHNPFPLVKHGRMRWVAEPRPSATQVFRLMFDLQVDGPGQPLYWILSAVSHATIGGWIQLMKAPIRGVALSSAAVLFAQGRACARLVEYMGWPASPWATWSQEGREFLLQNFQEDSD